MVIEATICHVVKADRLLLKKAARGISKGKWNAPGGKLDPAESPFANAKREVLEETALKVRNMTYHGMIRYFMAAKPILHTKAHLFSTRDFDGTPISTEEGELRWFHLYKLPFDQMWADDRYWIHLMLFGSHFDARFWFDRGNRKVTKYEIRSK